jgi:hypothetical protein
MWKRGDRLRSAAEEKSAEQEDLRRRAKAKLERKLSKDQRKREQPSLGDRFRRRGDRSSGESSEDEDEQVAER